MDLNAFKAKVGNPLRSLEESRQARIHSELLDPHQRWEIPTTPEMENQIFPPRLYPRKERDVQVAQFHLAVVAFRKRRTDKAQRYRLELIDEYANCQRERDNNSGRNKSKNPNAPGKRHVRISGTSDTKLYGSLTASVPWLVLLSSSQRRH